MYGKAEAKESHDHPIDISCGARKFQTPHGLDLARLCLHKAGEGF
jgi:hypothetical protein